MYSTSNVEFILFANPGIWAVADSRGKRKFLFPPKIEKIIFFSEFLDVRAKKSSIWNIFEFPTSKLRNYWVREQNKKPSKISRILGVSLSQLKWCSGSVIAFEKFILATYFAELMGEKNSV